MERAGVSDEVAQQVVAYCAAGLAALGFLPTRQRIVVERCFDDSEGTQLIVHSPFGGRMNRALGLALRKRFCVSFDFELQAAADDDTVVLSLGPQHSFPLAEVPSMLCSKTAAEVLTQAVLPHPMLAARWRWNLNRALVAPAVRAAASDAPSTSSGWRRTTCWPRSGPRWPPARRTPPRARWWSPITCWCARPWTTACTRGSRWRAWSICGRRWSRGDRGAHGGVVRALAPVARDLERPALHLPRRGAAGGAPHPGPLAAPWSGGARPQRAARAGRRAGSARSRRGGAGARPGAARPRDPDELHDLLLSLVACRPVPEWAPWFEALVADGRAAARRRLLGGRPSDGRPAAALADDDEARPRASAVISSWPARSPSTS